MKTKLTWLSPRPKLTRRVEKRKARRGDSLAMNKYHLGRLFKGHRI